VAAATPADLIAAQAAARARLTGTAVHAATSSVRGFSGWYDTAAITVLAQRITRHVESVQRQVAATTDAYLARLLSLLTGKLVRPLGPIDVAGLRQGVSHDAVYGRLANEYRWQRSQDKPETEALRVVTARAEAMVETDTALAHRAQARRVMLAHKVSGYRRIIRPELSRAGVCGLCVAASDRVYHRGDLRPIHARCNCEVAPIVGAHDPGKPLNAEDLTALYTAAGGTTSGPALKRVRYVVHNNGELGPVLGVAGQRFRGPDDIAA
jgi:hypothetical protein